MDVESGRSLMRRKSRGARSRHRCVSSLLGRSDCCGPARKRRQGVGHRFATLLIGQAQVGTDAQFFQHASQLRRALPSGQFCFQRPISAALVLPANPPGWHRPSPLSPTAPSVPVAIDTRPSLLRRFHSRLAQHSSHGLSTHRNAFAPGQFLGQVAVIEADVLSWANCTICSRTPAGTSTAGSPPVAVPHPVHPHLLDIAASVASPAVAELQQFTRLGYHDSALHRILNYLHSLQFLLIALNHPSASLR